MKKYFSKPFILIIAQCFGLMLLMHLLLSFVLAPFSNSSLYGLLGMPLKLFGILLCAAFLRKKQQAVLCAQSALRKGYAIALLCGTAFAVVLDCNSFWRGFALYQLPHTFQFDLWSWPVLPFVIYEQLLALQLITSFLLCALLVFAPKLSHKRSVSASS